jgi:membrane associated rhomboid family serine protease
MLVSRVANFNALWTLLTYGFVQFEFTHLLFNMLAFVIFGIQLERYFGSLKYGLFFLVTILGTGIITFFYHFILLEDVILLGASGGVYGVLMGYAVLRPEGRILIWGIIPIRAKFLVLLWAGISVFNIISGSQDNVSHIGHLSGFFVAWLYYLVVFRINPWHSFLGSSNNSSGGYGR